MLSMLARGLVISCATPAAICPIATIFSCWIIACPWRRSWSDIIRIRRFCWSTRWRWRRMFCVT